MDDAICNGVMFFRGFCAFSLGCVFLGSGVLVTRASIPDSSTATTRATTAVS